MLGEPAELALVEQQRLGLEVRLVMVHVLDPSHHEVVVTSVDDVVDGASIHAIAPSMIGDAVTGAGVHDTPSNGSSTLVFENCQQSSPCVLWSTFTQKASDVRISCHRSDVTIGRNPTSGGSIDTDMNDPIVNPTGRPSTLPGDHRHAGGEVAEHRPVPHRVDRHASTVGRDLAGLARE
jgi:hypothetical protein